VAEGLAGDQFQRAGAVCLEGLVVQCDQQRDPPDECIDDAARDEPGATEHVHDTRA
jgi:hypothetical protein